MRSKIVYVYVASTVLLAVVALFFTDWSHFLLLATPLRPDLAPAWIGLIALFVLGIFSEFLSVKVTVGKNSGASSILFIPLVAALLIFGPDPAALLALAAGAIGELFIRKKPPIRAAFNISQYYLSAFLGGHLFTWSGGSSFLNQTLRSSEVELQLIPFIVFVITFLLINTSAVAGAIALSQERAFYVTWTDLVGKSGSNLFYDLLISPIAVAVAFLYRDVGILGLAVTILPLLFIRHSYFVNLRLQAAIRDLLSALIKAIETRDPYTSGHSIRVADLSERIARSLGLPNSRVSDCRNAALLHDIGKIDPIYSEILKKPHSLTSTERRVIESHVEKGVELVESMASFPPNVIVGIRHHHERMDGQGYPDNLMGDQIPLEARIIKVCDAIDAMLSDRPYRKALPLEAVQDQLRQFSGTQFDPDVVEAVIRSDLLPDHAKKIKSDLGHEMDLDINTSIASVI